jgi:hypothetical protein
VARKGANRPIFEGETPPKKMYPQYWRRYRRHNRNPVNILKNFACREVSRTSATCSKKNRNKREPASCIRSPIKESCPTIYDEREGPTRRRNKDIQQNTRKKTRRHGPTLKEMAYSMDTGNRSQCMKQVKELAQENSKPIWEHFTVHKPAKTRVSRKISTRKHAKKTRTYNNPLTNVFIRLQKKRSLSRVTKKAKTRKYKKRRGPARTCFF